MLLTILLFLSFPFPQKYPNHPNCTCNPENFNVFVCSR